MSEPAAIPPETDHSEPRNAPESCGVPVGRFTSANDAGSPQPLGDGAWGPCSFRLECLIIGSAAIITAAWIGVVFFVLRRLLSAIFSALILP